VPCCSEEMKKEEKDIKTFSALMKKYNNASVSQKG
jgi:hypothetical protein